MEDDLYGGMERTPAAEGTLDLGLYEGLFTGPSGTAQHESYLQNKVDELEELLQEHQRNIQQLTAKLKDREDQLASITSERDTLLRNISCLYSTAKEEMARKQAEIVSLRAELSAALQQQPPQHPQQLPGRPQQPSQPLDAERAAPLPFNITHAQRQQQSTQPPQPHQSGARRPSPDSAPAPTLRGVGCANADGPCNSGASAGGQKRARSCSEDPHDGPSSHGHGHGHSHMGGTEGALKRRRQDGTWVISGAHAAAGAASGRTDPITRSAAGAGGPTPDARWQAAAPLAVQDGKDARKGEMASKGDRGDSGDGGSAMRTGSEPGRNQKDQVRDGREYGRHGDQRGPIGMDHRNGQHGCGRSDADGRYATEQDRDWSSAPSSSRGTSQGRGERAAADRAMGHGYAGRSRDMRGWEQACNERRSAPHSDRATGEDRGRAGDQRDSKGSIDKDSCRGSCSRYDVYERR